MYKTIKSGEIYVTKKKNNIELEQNIRQFREYKIIKSNDLIQKSRFQLSLQEQKIILYLISKIKPDDLEFQTYIFQIQEFSKICGIDEYSGGNYRAIKETIKKLADRSIWLKTTDERESLVRWINKAAILNKSGNIEIRLDDEMKPYLFELQKNFTQYGLVYILAMKSQYSIRLYEIFKSYENLHIKIFDIEELKKLLMCDNYRRFADFKRYVLEIALREINELADINITHEIIKEGRKFTKIKFILTTKKNANEKIKTLAKINNILNSTQVPSSDNELG